MYARWQLESRQSEGASTGSAGRRTPDFSVLTARESEVLLMLADGEPNRVLARRLGIAERTVRAHVTSLSRKLGVRSRIEAALLAQRVRDGVVPVMWPMA
ncbi:response regulator transcription factor [Streptomyces sp. GC420]|uniref:response regulator transcription factor n=1 Tax=Streptomyces sp. GC420 TaxID=2697568 RepID=UPI001414D5C3|nr:LuxR C-terminal-related transcriptional regulator [Streptomyces sp. GC420]NBM18997.1 DNA-binding response regulator [Streptomyces sp. GC420]